MQSRVFVLDDHVSSRTATTAAIQACGITVAGQAGTSPTGLAAAAASGAPIAMLSIEGKTRAHVIEDLRELAPAIHVLALIEDDDHDAFARARDAGADGVLPRSSAPEEVIDGVKRIVRGERIGTPPASPAPSPSPRPALEMDAPGDEDFELLKRLTPREDELLGLLSQGISAPVIARRLYLSRRTVEFHLARGYRKLEVRGRIDAIMKYARLKRALDVKNR